ncbi:unnamed protein product [Arctia plantaginis]|uniref:Uncharacterized protein n=1 Tax=Arctia plantaginis TaxID=874455 RepID=A0A8S1BGK8_ARCPL|nr:unnamed protein product [Arctia plantaginis]
MNFFAVLAFASVAAAARLDSSPLLPPHAETSGGSNADLQAPYNYEPSHSSGPAALQGGSFRGGSSASAQAQILRYENDINQDGYHYAYETSDGTKAEQTGRVFPGAQPEEGSLSVSGSYTYIGDDGQEYTVTYTADENGYRADGAHLPTPPPIPSEILKSLQLTDRSRGMYDSNKSSYDADAGIY